MAWRIILLDVQHRSDYSWQWVIVVSQFTCSVTWTLYTSIKIVINYVYLHAMMIFYRLCSKGLMLVKFAKSWASMQACLLAKTPAWLRARRICSYLAIASDCCTPLCIKATIASAISAASVIPKLAASPRSKHDKCEQISVSLQAQGQPTYTLS